MVLNLRCIENRSTWHSNFTSCFRPCCHLHHNADNYQTNNTYVSYLEN